ncbi:hypothetical protein syc0971_c [Synechococcus elongatus PCC 6301]|uniref:Uncharacterized protein n=1 Tax=Synechococcus sp. (strain ATCC 27144 / PCC 6301 / SAUG 1402/1) TaxID=269084 RepID=A0A0H3K1N1_SYNP6|nr:DUF6464 family protein [Synechococcus elongatus]BAD79161.1 hypothetical protein syc0971_c [Synechococcus elongatus PCC 6301]
MTELWLSAGLPTDVFLAKNQQHLGSLQLDWLPQPASHVEVADRSYAVLERRHRYQYRAGAYRLSQISLYVQAAPRPNERSFWQGRWVIGDSSCLYNAHSKLLRCAVQPEGPCAGCRSYEARSPEANP